MQPHSFLLTLPRSSRQLDGSSLTYKSANADPDPQLASITKRAKVRITDAEIPIAQLVSIFAPSAETILDVTKALTGGLWPQGHITLDAQKLRFTGDRSASFLLARSIDFQINLQDIQNVTVGSGIGGNRILTIVLPGGVLKVNVYSRAQEFAAEILAARSP
jgi:hypothetical protein